MNLEIQDPNLLASLTPQNVEAYLRSAGWEESHRELKKAAYYRKAAMPGDHEVLVPLSESASGYPQRVKELLRELKAAEERSELSIFLDIREQYADVLRVSLGGSGARLPSLGLCRLLFDTASELVYHSAKAIAPLRAREFTSSVEVSPFEEPFSVRLLLRVAPLAPAADDAFVPFARRVSWKLTECLGMLEQLVRAQQSGPIAASPAACGELSGVLGGLLSHPDAAQSHLDISLRLSPGSPANGNVESVWRFSRNDALALRELGERAGFSQSAGTVSHSEAVELATRLYFDLRMTDEKDPGDLWKIWRDNWVEHARQLTLSGRPEVAETIR